MKTNRISLIIIMLTSFFMFTCNFYYDSVKGEGEITSRILDIDKFSGINVNFASDVIISQGDNQEVKAKGHPNIIDKIQTNVKNDVWTIELEKGNYRDYSLTIYIKVPDITKVHVGGSSDILINKFYNQNDLQLNISGSGDINLSDFSGKDISIGIDGSGDVSLNTCKTSEKLSVRIMGSGSVKGFSSFPSLKDLNIDIIGSGDYDAFPIEASNCKVSIAGSGDCKLTALTKLDILINGSGDVYYKGNPDISKIINGSGSAISAN